MCKDTVCTTYIMQAQCLCKLDENIANEHNTGGDLSRKNMWLVFVHTPNIRALTCKAILKISLLFKIQPPFKYYHIFQQINAVLEIIP